MAKKKGLGKGLDALFIDNNTEDGQVTTLKLSEVEPNKEQPRTFFAEEALGELADSIRNHGVLQPLVVRPLESGGYQIVAGERRWRAARRAGLSEVPAVIRDLSEEETLEIAIIENLQREDLNVVELAKGYQALMDTYGMTQEQVAGRLGKPRSSISNTVRLLALPEEVLDEVSAGNLSSGHAKALLALEDPAQMALVARQAVQEQMPVRELEKLAQKFKEAGKVTLKNKEHEAADQVVEWGKNSFYNEVQLSLAEEMGRKVQVRKAKGKGEGGTLQLEFMDKQDLLDIVERLLAGLSKQ